MKMTQEMEIIMIVILFLICLFLFGMLFNQQKKFIDFKAGCAELTKILVEAQQACMDYANLTNDEFQDVYFEWGVEKVRAGEYRK